MASRSRACGGRGEVKDELVAVVHEARAVNRLVMSDGEWLRQPGGRADRVGVDGNRLDPVERVLEVEDAGAPPAPRRAPSGIGRLAADVQEQRTNRVEHVARGQDPPSGPLEILAARQSVVVRPVRDAQIAGGDVTMVCTEADDSCGRMSRQLPWKKR